MLTKVAQKLTQTGSRFNHANPIEIPGEWLMNLKVCHVCSGHSADDSRVFHKECVSLAKAGYEVHLIATANSSLEHQSRGVVVHPLEACRSRWSRLQRRSQVASRAKTINADLYHVHEPELLGPVLAAVGNRPVIFDVHESYLDTLSQRAWIPKVARPLARWTWERMEGRLVRRCAAIVTATDHIAKRYLSLHPQVVAIRNFAEISPDNIDYDRHDRDGRTCVFAGGLKPDRNLSNTVRALGFLKRKGMAVNLWLAGDWISTGYKDEILLLAKSEEVSEQIQDFGLLSHADAVALQARASIGLVNILPIPNSLNSLPVKMLECMALGLPLVYSNFPAFREVAGGAGSGITVDPEKPEEIAAALEFLVCNPALAQEMGEFGRRAVRDRLNWEMESIKLLDLYRTVLKMKAVQ